MGDLEDGSRFDLPVTVVSLVLMQVSGDGEGDVRVVVAGLGS